MTEEELQAIEARFQARDVPALVAEIRRLNAELRQWHDPVVDARNSEDPT